MNTTAHDGTSDQATLLGRTTEAFHEILQLVGAEPRWQQNTCRGLLAHLSAELLVLEQQAGRPLTLTDAVQFLCQAAEVPK